MGFKTKMCVLRNRQRILNPRLVYYNGLCDYIRDPRFYINCTTLLYKIGVLIQELHNTKNM